MLKQEIVDLSARLAEMETLRLQLERYTVIFYLFFQTDIIGADILFYVEEIYVLLNLIGNFLCSIQYRKNVKVSLSIVYNCSMPLSSVNQIK